MANFPGDRALGRGLVVDDGAHVPPEAAEWPSVVVDPAVLARPTPTVAALHAHWLERRPVVVRLEVATDDLRAPERCTLAPYELGPEHEFARERLQFLVWANNYDGRARHGGAQVWWHAERARRLGAGAATDAGTGGAERARSGPAGSADVRLPDGSEAWCDGGPRGPIAHDPVLTVLHREAIDAGSLRPDRWSPAGATSLHPDQLRAVSHRAGAARIIAPAGSGKTTVLTERLRHLLADRGVGRDCVLAVAFNKRAADEMVQRTGELRPHIRTLNSLGLAIVNGTPPFGPTGEERRNVIEEREVRQILESLLKVRRQANTDPWLPYLDALSTIRLGLVSPEDAEAEIPDATGIADAFGRYREILAERRLVDFDEQIYLAVELLLTRPDVRSAAQHCARHLLVDEFQDLNPAHLLLLRLVAAPAYDVFGVGDDDQVIYGYAGATPDYLIDYARWFPGATLYALETNYRCPPAVVTAASTLLAHNRRRIAKVVSPAPGREARDAQLRVLREPEAEQAARADSEIERWAADGAAWSEIAVLSRVNASLLALQVTLVERGVPCTTPLDADVLGRTGIRTALAYLRIATRPDHIVPADVRETIRRPSRKVAPNVVEMLTRRATSIAGIRRLAKALSGADVVKLDSYAADLDRLAASARTETTVGVLGLVRAGIGLGAAMDALDSNKTELDRSTHLDDLTALEQVATLHPDVGTFEPWLRSRLQRRGARGTPGGGAPDEVTLSTVHRVKGQEWPHVLVLGASEGLFPHRLATDVEEERRVFHVAVTRCSEDVVVLADDTRGSVFCDELFELPRPDPAGGPPRGEAAGRLRHRDQSRPALRRPPREPVPAASDDPATRAASAALRAWRRDVAGANKVPAFVVMSDVDLEGIARARPATLAELGRCRGIGPMKLERYGDELLALIESLAEV